MTITLAWWWLPMLLVVLGVVLACFYRSAGDYDFVTPLLAIGTFLVFAVAALGICIGRWMS